MHVKLLLVTVCGETIKVGFVCFCWFPEKAFGVSKLTGYYKKLSIVDSFIRSIQGNSSTTAQ